MNKKKLSLREKVFFSPWAILSVLLCGIGLMNVVAFADDNIIGYTEHGIAITEDDLSQELSVDRILEIDIKNIKKVDVNVLNINTAELYLDDKVYTVIVDCKLTEIDNFQWQTMGDGKLNIGDFAIVRRNPFTYFDNPKLELTREQIEAKLKDWDMNQRVCFIKALQKAGNIETPDVEETLNIRG